MFTFEGSNEDEVKRYATDHYDRLQFTFQLAKKYTPAQGNILDIGAKPFVLSYMLKAEGFDYTGIGVYSGEKDLRKNAVEACSISPASNKRFEINLISPSQTISIPLIETNIELNEWPFTPESFDTLIWTETMEHLTSDPSFAWHQANKVLKTGGKLIFSVPNALYWVRLVQLFFGKNIDDPYSWHGPFGRHNRIYTTKEVQILATLHGFKQVYLKTQTFIPKQQLSFKAILRRVLRVVSIFFGKRKGKTIVAVFEKVRESEKVERPSFLYH